MTLEEAIKARHSVRNTSISRLSCSSFVEEQRFGLRKIQNNHGLVLSDHSSCF